MINPFDYQRTSSGDYAIIDTRTQARVTTAPSQADAEETVAALWIGELYARAERAEAALEAAVLAERTAAADFCRRYALIWWHEYKRQRKVDNTIPGTAASALGDMIRRGEHVKEPRDA